MLAPEAAEKATGGKTVWGDTACCALSTVGIFGVRRATPGGFSSFFRRGSKGIKKQKQPEKIENKNRKKKIWAQKQKYLLFTS